MRRVIITIEDELPNGKFICRSQPINQETLDKLWRPDGRDPFFGTLFKDLSADMDRLVALHEVFSNDFGEHKTFFSKSVVDLAREHLRESERS